MRSTTLWATAAGAVFVALVDAAPKAAVVPRGIPDPPVRPGHLQKRQQAETPGYATPTFEVTLCPRPTGNNGGFIDPKSNLTFGCEPGFVCNPPMPDDCNFWPEPPTDDYVCPPKNCIKAPAYKDVEWDEDETSYYPPSNGYFALNPNAFGLAYDIFEYETYEEVNDGTTRTVTTGNWATQTDIPEWPPAPTTEDESTSVTVTTIVTTIFTTVTPGVPAVTEAPSSAEAPPTTTRGPSVTWVTVTIHTTTTVPYDPDAKKRSDEQKRAEEQQKAAAMLRRRALHWYKRRGLTTPSECFDDCDGAWKVAESVGKTSELCQEDGDFMINHDSCTVCVDDNSDETKDNKRDYIEPVFAQFLNYCDARDPDPTPSSTGGDQESQIESTSVPVTTDPQESGEETSFTPADPTTSSDEEEPSTTSKVDEPTTMSTSEVDEPTSTSSTSQADEPTSTSTSQADEPPTTSAAPPPTTTSSDDEPAAQPTTTESGDASPSGGNDDGGAVSPIDNNDDGQDEPVEAPEEVTSAVITLVETTTDASGAEITTTRTSMAVFGTPSTGGSDIAISTGVTTITATTKDAAGNVVTTTSESALWGVASAVPKPDNGDDGVVFIPPKDDDPAQPTPTSSDDLPPAAGASGLTGSSMVATLLIMIAALFA